mgnify:CR=1 FL=1
MQVVLNRDPHWAAVVAHLIIGRVEEAAFEQLGPVKVRTKNRWLHMTGRGAGSRLPNNEAPGRCTKAQPRQYDQTN